MWFKILSNSLNSVECLFVVMKSDFLPNNMEINLKIQQNKIKCLTNNWNAIDTFINTLKSYGIIDNI